MIQLPLNITATDMFTVFLRKLDNDGIKEATQYIEMVEKHVLLDEVKVKIKDASVWFRFFEGDTAATTIENIVQDAGLPKSHPNYKYIRECLEMAINNPKDIMVYYS